LFNPTKIFEVGTEYYLNTSQGFVKDICGEEFDAITDKTTLRWKTDEITL
jgi:hypothetical protein